MQWAPLNVKRDIVVSHVISILGGFSGAPTISNSKLLKSHKLDFLNSTLLKLNWNFLR